MKRLYKNLDHSKIKCDECKGKPDYVYFDKNSGQILSVICKDCKKAFEATIKAMGTQFLDMSKLVH